MRWMTLFDSLKYYITSKMKWGGGITVDKTVNIRSKITFSCHFASTASVNLIGGKPLGTGNDYSTFSILIYRILRRHQILYNAELEIITSNQVTSKKR